MPPRHGPTSTRLRHLGDDLLRHVLTHLRCDRLGNETVPGLIFEARVWRRLGKRFLRLSRDTPSKFDARIAYTKDGVLPRSFAGGLLCSPSSVGTVLEDDDASVSGKGAKGANNVAPPVFRQKPQLFLLRAAHTGRIWSVVCAGWRTTAASEGTTCNTVLLVHVVLVLQHLVQLLSGQNADFDTRLDHFDKLVRGLEVKLDLATYFATNQSATGFKIPTMNRDSSSAVEVNCTVKWLWLGLQAHKLPLTNTLHIQYDQGNEEVAFLKTDHGALRNNDQRYPKLPPISILLGFYDNPEVAECGAMQVSIHTHRLPKTLLPRPKANDPELHLRILGRAALDRAERVASEQNAIVVRRYQHGVLAAARPGPSGVPSRRPRDAAINARDGIRAGVQADNDTLSTGRLRFIRQMGDNESREAEAGGYVDDQYAGFGEEDDEPIIYDSDGAYDDRLPKRSKRAMAKERRAEAVAAHSAASRAWMIPSSEDDDDDEEIEDI